MTPTRDLLRLALEDAEAVLREYYGPDAVADRMLVSQVAVIAADIRIRLGEANLGTNIVDSPGPRGASCR